MRSEWIQVRLTRNTRERLREYAEAVVATGKVFPSNRANRVLSPEEAVIRLLDQWEGHRGRARKARNSVDKGIPYVLSLVPSPDNTTGSLAGEEETDVLPCDHESGAPGNP